MKNKSLYIIVLTILSVMLVGCANADSADTSSEQIEVIDSMNHQVNVPLDPQRVAVFDNAQMDNMDTLGLGERIIATASSQLPNYLEEYREVEVAGTLHEIDLEITMSTKPELAIVATRSSSSFDRLSEFIPTVDLSLTETTTFESIQTNVRELARIFKKEQEAEQILKDLEEEKNTLFEQASSSELTALMVMYNGGSLSAFGPNSRYGQVYDDFGFKPVDENIAVSKHGMEISYEYIVRENPDILFVLDRSSAIAETESTGSAIENFEENPLMEAMKAYQNDQIHYLTSDMWYLSNGGIQAYQQMIQDVWPALEK